MPRTMRKKSSIGLYHVMLRAVNKQLIFLSDADNLYFLQTLEKVKTISQFDLCGFCLMGNHVHLLIREKEGGEPLDKIMKRTLNRFIAWYNSNYDRCGPLFCGRYKSEAIEDERYFLAALRYIHNNPVKAGLSRHMAWYKWSSYRDYIDGKSVLEGLVDTKIALGIAGREELKRFFGQETEEIFLEDFTESERKSAYRSLCALIFRGYSVGDFSSLSADDKMSFVEKCKKKGIPNYVIYEVSGATEYQIKNICYKLKMLGR